MRLSLEALQVLDAIDRRGSFASAATELHRVPSAITYSVRQLEEGLGIELFDRAGHRAVLTEAGRELLAEGRLLLQAAADLECRVQQVARGWESELRIAVDTLIGLEKLFRTIAEFYTESRGTRLRISHEVLGGVWDALASGRADLGIGASGDAPAGRSFASRRLGRAEMRFVAAPFHPLCTKPQPLSVAAMREHRAVSIADTSRLLPPRTVGLISGQDVLTVPSLEAKTAALVAGLGVGFVPRWIAEREGRGWHLADPVDRRFDAFERAPGRVAPGAGGQGAQVVRATARRSAGGGRVALVSYRGRFAPSPTGPLHFGSLVAAVASWLDARAAGGEWLVRIEDVDTPRTVPGAADEILRTLEAFGLHWDREVVWQSRRTGLYEEALARLRTAGATYRCKCSRREISDSGLVGPEGAIYPGTCRRLGLGMSVIAERLEVTGTRIAFRDRVQGPIAQDLERDVGDFIVKRRDGLHAYQLAVVVDDADQAITDVVRGADLLWSTPRQIALQRRLDHSTPSYLHVPVATNERGEKLSKQTLAPPADARRAPETLQAVLAFLRQAPAPGSRPAEILSQAAAAWDPAALAGPRSA
jgi:glutamyl-Q tRNA(Asp) synthetase